MLQKGFSLQLRRAESDNEMKPIFIKVTRHEYCFQCFTSNMSGILT